MWTAKKPKVQTGFEPGSPASALACRTRWSYGGAALCTLRVVVVVVVVVFSTNKSDSKSVGTLREAAHTFFPILRKFTGVKS